MIPAVKFVDGSETELEGLLLPYGGLHNGADLYGERFTAKTDFCLEWSNGGQLPLLFQHGLDPAIETEVVGRIKGITFKADGGWMQAQLDASAKYFEQISQLVKAGKLFLSSGAMAHLVKVSKSGDIERWPTVEGSMTPTPANLLAKLDFATASRHYKSAGIDLPDALAAEPTEQATTDEGATLSAPIKAKLAGSYEQLRGDLEDACNPVDPVTGYRESDCYILATFSDHCIVKRYEDPGETFWKIAYTLDENGKPVIGESQQVEQTYVPVKPERPMGMMARAVAIDAASLLERTKGLQQRRIKEGRMLSGANRKRLSQCVEAMNAAVTELQGLLDSSEPQTAKAASLRRLRATLIAQQIEAMTLN